MRSQIGQKAQLRYQKHSCDFKSLYKISESPSEFLEPSLGFQKKNLEYQKRRWDLITPNRYLRRLLWALKYLSEISESSMKSQKAPSKYQKPLWDLRSLPETSKTSWNLRFHFRILEGPSEITYNPHVFRRLLLDLRNLSEISKTSWNLGFYLNI